MPLAQPAIFYFSTVFSFFRDFLWPFITMLLTCFTYFSCFFHQGLKCTYLIHCDAGAWLRATKSRCSKMLTDWGKHQRCTGRLGGWEERRQEQALMRSSNSLLLGERQYNQSSSLNSLIPANVALGGNVGPSRFIMGWMSRDVAFPLQTKWPLYSEHDYLRKWFIKLAWVSKSPQELAQKDSIRISNSV